MRLPATPGWVSLPVMVGVPRHSRLKALGAVPRHSWLGSAGGGGVRLPANPGWGLLVAVGVLCGSGCPLLCVFAVVVGPLPLLAVGPGCWAPPLLAGACSRVPWLVPRNSCPRTVGVVPRHSWLGSTGCGDGGPGSPSLWSWCVSMGAAWRFSWVWVAWGGSSAVRLPCVCVCVRAVCGWWGVSYPGWFSSSVGMSKSGRERAKKTPCRRVAEMRGMRNTNIHTSLCPTALLSPCRERVCAGLWGVGWLFLRVVPCVSFFFRSVFDNIPLCLAFSL